MHQSPPLHPNPTDFAISGDVTLAPSAAIASGVLLHADPDSQIVIGAGVCIGVGAILHAHQGLIEIRVGATIGAGVLMIGSGEIGVNACIGSGTTLINPAIAAEQVVASGSLIGDSSRQLEENVPSDPPPETDAVETEPQSDSIEGDSSRQLEENVPSDPPPETDAVEPEPQSDSIETVATDETEAENPPASSPPETPAEEEKPQFPQPQVYGQASLDHLLDRLLPHRKFNQNSRPKSGEISTMGDEQTE